MIVILAEKPSVAREIAMLVGAKIKRDGFIEGNGYCVTWAIGHLVSLAMPEDYGFQGFKKRSFANLTKVLFVASKKDQKSKQIHF